MASLREMRESKDLSAEQVIEQGRRLTRRFPKTPHAIYKFEKIGTDKHTVVVALSIIYERPISEIEAAAGCVVPEYCEK